MKLAQLIFSLFLVSLNPLRGQDPVYYQFFTNKTFLNPAFAGYDGGFDFFMISKHQWGKACRGTYGTNGNGCPLQEPFLSSSFGFDAEVLSSIRGRARMGVGLMYTRNTEGFYKSAWDQYQFSFAFRNRPCRLPDKTRVEVNLGGSITYHTMNPSQAALVYSDQLDPFQGYRPGTPTLAPISPNDLGVFDRGGFGTMGIGGVVSYLLAPNTKADFIRIGISRNQALEGFQSSSVLDFPTRHTIHATGLFSAYESRNRQRNNKDIYLIPIGRFTTQNIFRDPDIKADSIRNNYQLLDLGMMSKFKLGLEHVFNFGASHRWVNRLNKNAIAPPANSATAFVGYELPLSSSSLNTDGTALHFMVSSTLHYQGVGFQGGLSWEVSIVLRMKNLLKTCGSCQFPF